MKSKYLVLIVILLILGGLAYYFLPKKMELCSSPHPSLPDTCRIYSCERGFIYVPSTILGRAEAWCFLGGNATYVETNVESVSTSTDQTQTDNTIGETVYPPANYSCPDKTRLEYEESSGTYIKWLDCMPSVGVQRSCNTDPQYVQWVNNNCGIKFRIDVAE